MCYQPIQIENPKFGMVGQERYLLVNCRKCLECRQKRANEWALRCMAEAQKYQQNCFLTLTYEKSPLFLKKRDLQLFLKRFRKAIYPHKIKYFACGEYGSKNYRPHFHLIIFGYDFEDKYLWSRSDVITLFIAVTKLRHCGSLVTVLCKMLQLIVVHIALYMQAHKNTKCRSYCKHILNSI